MERSRIAKMPTGQLETALDQALDVSDEDLANLIQDELDRRNLTGTMEDPYPHDEADDLGSPGSYAS